MKLSAAAKYFDDVTCADAFTPFATFKGQLDVYDDSKRDGLTVLRRILSVAPAVTVPARRVITIAGEHWMVGTREADHFKGSAVRDKYVIHRAEGVCTIKTPAQALATGGVTTYASRVWVKDVKEAEVSSKLIGFFNVYLPALETVAANNILSLAGKLNIVRNVFTSAAGFKVAEVDEIADGALQSAVHKSRAYTPATDTFTETPATVTTLRLRFQDSYTYLTEAAPKMVEGDIQIFAPKSVTPKARDLFTFADGNWQAISVQDEGSVWLAHLRRDP